MEPWGCFVAEEDGNKIVGAARTKAERVSQERLAEVTKGLPLPPGLNLF